MASGLLVYDDSIDTNGIHQVLFIDSTECVFQNYANTVRAVILSCKCWIKNWQLGKKRSWLCK